MFYICARGNCKYWAQAGDVAYFTSVPAFLSVDYLFCQLRAWRKCVCTVCVCVHSVRVYVMCVCMCACMYVCVHGVCGCVCLIVTVRP